MPEVQGRIADGPSRTTRRGSFSLSDERSANYLLSGQNPGERDSEGRHDQACCKEHDREDECLIKRQVRGDDALHAFTLDLDRP